MSKWVKAAVLAVNLLVLIGIAGYTFAFESGSLFDVPLVENAAPLTEGKTENLGGVLLFNGETLPYDAASETYYVSQSMRDADWDGRFSWSEGAPSLYLQRDDLLRDKAAALAAGEPFTLLAVDGEQYAQARVVFTGLPVLTLRTDRTEPVTGEKYTYKSTGEVCLYDPDNAQSGRYSILRSAATFRPRGATSMSFPKTSYRIGLLDDEGRQRNLSFLGLREDDDWLLNSLYSDRSKVRDKLSLDLWNEIAETADYNLDGTHMRYVEVFLDDAYYGLYGLMEPIDQKSFELDRELDRLYKTIHWYIPNRNDMLASRNELENMSVSIKWPKEMTSSQLWAPFREYLDMFIHNPKLYSFETMVDRLNLSNTIDYCLFISASTAIDNTFKNIYYYADVEPDGSYRFTKIPWDLNYTWGEAWTDANPTYSFFNPEQVSANYIPMDTVTLLWKEPETVAPLMEARWTALRERLFDTERLSGRMDELIGELQASGAFARDTARWPGSHNSADLSEMQEFLPKRMAYLDAYFRDLDAHFFQGKPVSTGALGS